MKKVNKYFLIVLENKYTKQLVAISRKVSNDNDIQKLKNRFSDYNVKYAECKSNKDAKNLAFYWNNNFRVAGVLNQKYVQEHNIYEVKENICMY